MSRVLASYDLRKRNRSLAVSGAHMSDDFRHLQTNFSFQEMENLGH